MLVVVCETKVRVSRRENSVSNASKDTPKDRGRMLSRLPSEKIQRNQWKDVD
jgi:hypothetical protein